MQANTLITSLRGDYGPGIAIGGPGIGFSIGID